MKLIFWNMQIVKAIIALCLLFPAASAVQGNEKLSFAEVPTRGGDSALGIVGYNYTNQEIDHYSVDGISGGAIRMSSPSSGGSGITCCVRLPKENQKKMRVTIRWQIGGCRYTVRNDETGRSSILRHLIYKEAEVPVTSDFGRELAYLETHFYPDGSVRVRLTEEVSLPLFSLNAQRAEKTELPRCQNDKKPN